MSWSMANSSFKMDGIGSTEEIVGRYHETLSPSLERTRGRRERTLTSGCRSSLKLDPASIRFRDVESSYH